MAAKRPGERPRYDLAKARCAKTALNPQTSEPFSRPLINGVLTTECYDVTASVTRASSSESFWHAASSGLLSSQTCRRTRGSPPKVHGAWSKNSRIYSAGWMFGENARNPRTMFTDGGPGFYHRRWGTMTGEYEIALRRHGIKAWAGPNALRGPRAQPADVLLHETAISWLRRRREKTRPNMPWLETPAVFAARLERVVCGINAEYKVRELCLEFPERLRRLVEETHGDRLPK